MEWVTECLYFVGIYDSTEMIDRKNTTSDKSNAQYNIPFRTSEKVKFSSVERQGFKPVFVWL